MAQFSIPAAPAAYQTVYAGFKGVDLTTDALKISPSRASMALNMISDAGGNPEKRVGWRTLHALDGRINGLHPMQSGAVGISCIACMKSPAGQLFIRSTKISRCICSSAIARGISVFPKDTSNTVKTSVQR